LIWCAGFVARSRHTDDGFSLARRQVYYLSSSSWWFDRTAVDKNAA